MILIIALDSYGQDRERLHDSLLEITKVSQDNSQKALAHSKLAWMYLNTDVHKVREHLDTSMLLYNELQDTNGIAVSNYKYAVLYRLTGDYNEAHRYIDLYIDFASKKNDTFKIANSAYQKGVIYSLQADYESSLKEYHKTLDLYEKVKDSAGMGFTLNSIGIVYKNLKKFDKALETYQQAVLIHQHMNDKANLANVYNSIGAVHAEQHNTVKALEYYKKTLQIDEEIDNNWGIAKVSNNVAHLYIDENNYMDALGYLNMALSIQEENEFYGDIAETLTQLSIVYLNLGDYQKSEMYLNNVFQRGPASVKDYQLAHQQAYQLYETIGKPKIALEHYRKYILYKDSIFNENNLKNINTLQIQYETEKKDKSLLQQQVKLQEQELEIQKRNKQVYYSFGLAMFLLIIALSSWMVFRQKQKRKNQELLTLKREYQIKSLESLIEGEEKERFRIAKELHDGVNGDLSAIKHKLSALLEMNNKIINEAIVMIDHSCDQVRAISHNLVPPSLENFNLVEATENYCTNLNGVNKENISFQYIGNELVMPKKAEINAFRIIQELITNALKHASATEIDVQISHRDDVIQITVEDNGKGFDKNQLDGLGIGLSNIQSRVDYLKAHMDMVSNKMGTSYTIDIDLKNLNEN